MLEKLNIILELPGWSICPKELNFGAYRETNIQDFNFQCTFRHLLLPTNIQYNQAENFKRKKSLFS